MPVSQTKSSFLFTGFVELKCNAIVFLFPAFLVLILTYGSCASSYYKDLRPAPDRLNCLPKFKPYFKANWYHASIEVAGKHISGLLLFKHMSDSSLRIVFTNEAGISFFDFGFNADGGFTVYQVIRQLNRKVVIALLRKDFEMILMVGVTAKPLKSFIQKDEIFYALPRKNETDYFITDKDCASLLRIERASRRIKKTEVIFAGVHQQAPDSINLKHFTFNMQISLKKLPR